jgi:hypothetical protein
VGQVKDAEYCTCLIWRYDEDSFGLHPTSARGPMPDHGFEEDDNDFMHFVGELVRAHGALPPYDKKKFDLAAELARDPLRAPHHAKPTVRNARQAGE